MFNKKNIIIISGILGILVIMIIVFVFISGRERSYEDIEQKLIKSAQKYFKANPDQKPVENGTSVVVSGATLEESYMRPISKMVKEGVVCNSEVRLIKNNDNYSYIPYLNCGPEYISAELSKTIIEKNEINPDGAGLYSTGESYYFKGEFVDNYLEFDEKTYRIIDIREDGAIRAVDMEPIPRIRWDNRYNIERKSSVGNNYFESETEENSRFKTFLDKHPDTYISEDSVALLTSQNLCLSSANFDTLIRSNSYDCNKESSPILLGTISANDISRVSLDKNCNKLTAYACRNYNYLAYLEGTLITTTAFSENSYQIFTYDGSFEEKNASTYTKLYTTIMLDSNVVYASGDGTKENPYKLRY